MGTNLKITSNGVEKCVILKLFRPNFYQNRPKICVFWHKITVMPKKTTGIWVFFDVYIFKISIGETPNNKQKTWP